MAALPRCAARAAQGAGRLILRRAEVPARASACLKEAALPSLSWPTARPGCCALRRQLRQPCVGNARYPCSWTCETTHRRQGAAASSHTIYKPAAGLGHRMPLGCGPQYASGKMRVRVPAPCLAEARRRRAGCQKQDRARLVSTPRQAAARIRPSESNFLPSKHGLRPRLAAAALRAKRA